MSRPLRIEFAGALYHVTSRSDGREVIFLDDEDKHRFLDVLSELVQGFNWAVHAYCLMDNHYHLLIETPESNLSRGMRQLNEVYTQRLIAGTEEWGMYSRAVIRRSSCRRNRTCWNWRAILSSIRSGLVWFILQKKGSDT